MPPLVTIVIPTYNRAALVTRAIESALAQTYQALCVVIVDDGSTDNTHEVLQRYTSDPRVRIVTLVRNSGVTAAKNAGLAAVTAETSFVGILDSDDTLERSALDVLVGAFDDEGRRSQVFGWCVDVQGQRTGTMTRVEGPITYDDAISGRFSGEFWQLIRWRYLAGRRFDERALGGEAAVWWPMLKEGDGWLVSDVVRRYDSSGADRVSAISHTPLAARGRMWACQVGLSAVAEDLRDRYPTVYGERLIELAKWAALAGDSARARTAAREALRYVRSIRAVATALLALLPQRVARSIAAWRNRLRDLAPAR